MKRSAGGVLLAALLAPAAAQAQIDPRVALLFEHRAREGRTAPFFRASRAFERTGRAPLLLRYRRAPSPVESARYAALGLELGRPLASGAVPAEVSEQALEAMRRDHVLARATVHLAPAFLARPLDAARVEVGLLGGLASYRALLGAAPGGDGVRVGDVDGTLDVFHPAFFSALPPVAWVDVNGDGRLTPGVDGFDTNGDGVISAPEVLRLLNGEAKSYFALAGAIDATDDAGLNPGWDYLYQDTDGDGRRGAGAAFGPGAEARPAYGEPVFAVDDVNGDGVVTADERLVPLGASKVLAIRHGGGVFRRGQNLSAFAPNASGPDDAVHATLALGTVAGGQPGVSRFLGLAPGVEILLATDQWDNDPLTAKLQWLRDEGAQIILTEFNSWGTEPSDGSTDTEELLDSLVDAGVAVVSPAGNLALSGKHALALVPAAGAAPIVNGLSRDLEAPSVLWLSITWPEGDALLAGSLGVLGDSAIDLGVESASSKTSGGLAYVVSRGVTARGAGYVLCSVAGPGGVIPPQGTTLSLRSSTAAPLHASLFVADDRTSWQGGVRFTESDVAGSMTSPSFAARTLAVSAYALHRGADWSSFPGDTPGQIRVFSGRGPDVWGKPGIAIAAPDNAVAALPDLFGLQTTHGQGTAVRYSEFGGTSGAGAEVAGMLALLKQGHPELGGAALSARLLEAARKDTDVNGGAATEWGAGKLRIDRSAAGGPPLRVGLKAQTTAPPGSSVVVEVSVSGGQGPAQVRWDEGYDGRWETGLVAPDPRAIPMPPGGPLDVKVEAVDAAGFSAAASVRVLAVPVIEPDGGPGAPDLPPDAAAPTEAGPRRDPPPPGTSTPGACGCAAPGGEGSGASGGGLAALAAFAIGRRSRRLRRRSGG